MFRIPQWSLSQKLNISKGGLHVRILGNVFFRNKNFKFFPVFSSRMPDPSWVLDVSWIIFRCMKPWSSTFLSEGSQSPVFVSLTIRLEPLQASSSDSIPNVIGQSLDCPGRRPLSWCDIPSRYHRLGGWDYSQDSNQLHLQPAKVSLGLRVNQIKNKYNLNLLHLTYGQAWWVWSSVFSVLRWDSSISPLK